MMNTVLVSSFGQMVFDSSLKKGKVKAEQNKDPEENQIIEAYEGDCEKCESIKPQKACSVCAE